MLKRVPVEQLRLGMHIHELCGSWINHPFWRSEFRLNSPKELQMLLASNVKEVWIDTNRGHDVDEIASELPTVDQVDALQTSANSFNTQSPHHSSITREAAQATIICAKSKHAVTSMFHEARMGKALDAEEALPIVEEISSSVLRNPGALIGLARLKNKDDYTYMHSVAVCALMVSLARTTGWRDNESGAIRPTTSRWKPNRRCQRAATPTSVPGGIGA